MSQAEEKHSAKSVEHWTGLSGSSSAWAVVEYLRSQPDSPVVIVLPEEKDLSTFRTDLGFFLQLTPLEKSVQFFEVPERLTDVHPEMIPDPERSAQRLGALYALANPNRKKTEIFLISISSLGQKTIPQEWLYEHSGALRTGATIDREELIEKLYISGFEKESLVQELGTYAVRGSIVDFYPPNAELPVRVELFGDTVESIRPFDPDNQKSLDHLDSVSWVPSKEFIISNENKERLLHGIKDLADRRNLPPAHRFPLEDAVENRRYIPQLASMPSIFYPEMETFFEFVPPNAQWMVMDPFSVEREWADRWQEIRKADAGLQENRILASDAASMSMDAEELMATLWPLVRMHVSDVAVEKRTIANVTKEFSTETHEDLRRLIKTSKDSAFPLEPIIEKINAWGKDGLPALFIAETEAGAKRIHGLLSEHIDEFQVFQNIQKLQEYQGQKTGVLIGALSHGFKLPSLQLNFITESDLFGEKKHTLHKKASKDDLFANVSDIQIGDPVVHIDHGIGIYRGLQRLSITGVDNDFISLEYAESNKLYLPIYRLNRIHRYLGGDPKKVSVDRLGSKSSWQKTKARAKRAVEDMAEELIKLYAARKVAKSRPFSPPDETYLGFEADFPFEETRDQLHAIDAVSKDLTSNKPMDRLICGDVGFGKTEVALRAAFRAAMDGKQAAVLVPTTILAQQHYETFKARFSKYPVQIDFLSRFKGRGEQKEVVESLKDGKLDIVIGTHRLLSKDIAFKELGLLIVDEEHRFGVKHKEKIKQFRNKVDVLTLTATPIPRTLQMSVSGLRDLSVINTPPLDRKAVQTYLCKFDDRLIQGAIEKELARNGQVYFVHNRVQTIDAMGGFLKNLVPKAKIQIAHGQLTERQLEKTMLRFLHHEFDVLLCTTIIESGLDIPNANTLIIDRADRFGLAQLYQLRGRVGRSDRNAFAYLLIPGEDIISKDALKRLKVLKRFTELGSGLKIALHDLEIRGAGNLLGSEQSGQIDAVGFELYTELLEEEIKRLKGEEVEDEIEPEIHCQLQAFLPPEYVNDSAQRFVLYKRLSSTRTLHELEETRAEFLDRFGPIEGPVANLFKVIELKVMARELSISSLRLGSSKPSMEFTKVGERTLQRILTLLKRDKRLKLHPNNRMTLALSDSDDIILETKKILQAIL